VITRLEYLTITYLPVRSQRTRQSLCRLLERVAGWRYSFRLFRSFTSLSSNRERYITGWPNPGPYEFTLVLFLWTPFYLHVYVSLPGGLFSLKKVMQSYYKPGQALRVPRGWGSQIFRQSAHGGGTYAPAAFIPQEVLLVPISVRGWVDPRATVQPKGLCQWKIPVTPSGIEPATFRFVV
jgi:hypothetical protein